MLEPVSGLLEMEKLKVFGFSFLPSKVALSSLEPSGPAGCACIPFLYVLTIPTVHRRRVGWEKESLSEILRMGRGGKSCAARLCFVAPLVFWVTITCLLMVSGPVFSTEYIYGASASSQDLVLI